MGSWPSGWLRSGSESANGSVRFLVAGPTPLATLDFEQELQALLREVGRLIVEYAYNRLEPDEAEELPQHLDHDGQRYRRLNQKTPKGEVATLFGKITLHRHGYRPMERDSSEPTIFPLELQLGLVEGATPALAGEAARSLAEAGATQQVVLARLKERHGVQWGVKKLRAVTANVAASMEEHRREQQAQQIVQWLKKAHESTGKNRVVLAAGRDGITLCTSPHSFYEVATTATLTVYDRRGKRLGSVYLAYAPELGQQAMSDELTALIEEVLRRWEGPLPRLAYITDAGDNETGYYQRVLKNLTHPTTGKRLVWQWIVDFYHAAQRLTAMGEALFGVRHDNGRQAAAWAARMSKLLKKPNGPFRVLHAAAAMRARRSMSATAGKEFRTAYNYLRTRTRHMQYAKFLRQGLPIGSGVTEAACKTVFTQRLKLSGMRWSRPGAQTILDLRVILLSSIWHRVYRAAVSTYQQRLPRTPHTSLSHHQRNAA